MPQITDALVLPEDVLLSPVSDLAEKVRQRLDWSEGDVAITRLRSRTPSKIVNAEAACLLEEFRSASTISEAVLRYSVANNVDPHATLNEAFPLLRELVNSQLLVPTGTRQAAQIIESLKPGQQVDGLTIVRCVQSLEDTELYQAREAAGQLCALKVARSPGRSTAALALRREANVLQEIGGRDGRITIGDWEERTYLSQPWHEGVPVDQVAEEERLLWVGAGRKGLLALCVSVLQAYQDLHDCGVIHGDVHPRNLLVDGRGRVRIIDFGLAQFNDGAGEEPAPPRGGVAFFFEPEYARARLARLPPPALSIAGEQYSLAAMVYLLLTGEHYLDFALGEEEMLRQIADASPRAFADRGVAPWPGVEAALHRALEKDPKARFPDVAALAEALERAAGEPAAGAGISAPIVTRGIGDRLASRVLQRLGWDGALMNGSWPGPPTASINYGAAGAAYFLYRASCLRGDPALLALADVWSARAAQAIGLDEGFYNPAIEITSETVGRISPYHSPSGVHAVQALIARARGDDVALGEALHRFIDSIQSPCANPDLTLGQCGVLLATTLLVEALPESSPVDLSGLLAMGRSRAEQISGLIDAPDAVRDMARMPLLGIAHGWAGLLYGTLRWCETTRQSPPDRLVERLDELADLAEPVGRGMRWPWQLGLAELNYMPGWCNGSAGYVYLWTLAHRLLDRRDYAALAEKAAWNAWEDPSPAANLCCGWAGRGFAMLHWYKHTGESLWLQRAQVAARRAAELIGPSMAQSADGFENSLYKGELGVAALAIEVDYPDQAAMPFFESERTEH